MSNVVVLAEFNKAVALIDGEPSVAVAQLESLQEKVPRSSIISNNETLDDIATINIPWLSLEHNLAKALTQLPIAPGASMRCRLMNLQRACDLWANFFQTLENMEILSTREQGEYHALLDLSSTSDNNGTTQPTFLTTSRDTKIARFNAKKQVQQDIERLHALMERRRRLGLGTEQLDGHDQESLERSLALKSLELAKQDAMEEWSSVVQELPMLSRMVKQQEHDHRETERYSGNRRQDKQGSTRDSGPPPPRRPLQVTHLTKDATTGHLQIRKEEIRSQVFQRGWNQPTMSLEELAEREVGAALEREKRQKQQEAAQEGVPRRYEQLVKAGLEDNADLVDASAPLDRAWDKFKDENPRGSGNKRGDVGDRNF